MKLSLRRKSFILPAMLLLLGWQVIHSQDSTAPSPAEEPLLIAPAKTTHTGLLLHPDLDLAWYTREKFIEDVSTVGRDKIGKSWTSPVVTLPPHPRVDPKVLTEDEVKAYMLEAKRLFDRLANSRRAVYCRSM